jgi:hypothetical protein
MPSPQLAGMLVHGPVLAMQRPPEQQPLEHALPAQQTSPRPPQRAHMASDAVPEHTVPAWQGGADPPAGQHSSPAWPQDEHNPLLHASPP